MILLETILQDLRYGVRTLCRNPGFTAAAVFALALGIGLNTAVFSAYKAMVARPLDARNPGEMVNLALIRDSGATNFKFSYPDYEAYRDSIHSFSGLAAFSPEHMKLSTGTMSKAESVSVFVVSGNYFKVLGIGASRGRTFDSIGVHELIASSAVLISDNCWQRRFERDPAILGKSIQLNGVAVTIAGITAHNFVGTGVAVPDFGFRSA